MRRLCLMLVLAACGGGGGASPVDGQAPPDGAVGDAPPETWSWVPVPGMTCGDGSPTGIAINPTARSSKLVIMFEGGGACWEAAACYGILVPVTAAHLDGFDAQTFASVRPAYFDSSWLFQRDEPTSLLGDATWVFVPYCTGDLHAGTQTTVYEALGQMATMHHVGANNVDAVLGQLASLAPTEVFAMGVSAGGYGVQLNWDRIAAAFPSATTHAFADGAQLVPIEAGRHAALMQRWAPRFPAGCTDCATNMDRVAAHWRTSPPATGGRYALTSSLRDGVLALYFGYDGAGMRAASLPIGTAMTGTQAAFMIDSDSHTMLSSPATRTSTNVELKGWVEAWITGGAAFATTGP